MTDSLVSLLGSTPVLPVVVIDDASQAPALARALLNGGINAIEITLRTAAALDSIRAVAREVPGMRVGVGTVLSANDLQQSAAAGATFAVSPGATPTLLAAARTGPIPLLPGVATTSDIMVGIEHGYSFFKFFPASAAGGVEMLKAFAGPFGNVRFCPTGGINLRNAADYLALKNVICIGGSWIVPVNDIKERNWSAIESLSREAVQTLRPQKR